MISTGEFHLYQKEIRSLRIGIFVWLGIYFTPLTIAIIGIAICASINSSYALYGWLAFLEVWLLLMAVPFIVVIIILSRKISNRKRKIQLYNLEQQYDNNK